LATLKQLSLGQLCELAAHGDEFVKRASFGDPAAIEYEDLIGRLDGA
jgi:hypothetical protein